MDALPELAPGVKEALWVQWLNDLAPWERHWVFQRCELDWHDDFVLRGLPLLVFRQVLDQVEFEGVNLHSVKV